MASCAAGGGATGLGTGLSEGAGLSVGSLTRKTPYETAGNVFLVAGLLTLVAGTLYFAIRQQRSGAALEGAS